MTSDYLSAALIDPGRRRVRAAAHRGRQVSRARAARAPAKDYPYECGSEVIGSPRARFEVKFYQVAIVFLVFDIETAFLYPWALKLPRALLRGRRSTRGDCSAGVSFFGLGEILVFMGILIVALAYVWRKRAVGWE